MEEATGSIPVGPTNPMGHVYGVAGDPCKIAVMGFDSPVLHQRLAAAIAWRGRPRKTGEEAATDLKAVTVQPFIPV